MVIRSCSVSGLWLHDAENSSRCLQSVGSLLLSGRSQAQQLASIAGVVLLRTWLQDRIASLNGRSVEHVLRQVRLATLLFLLVHGHYCPVAANACARAGRVHPQDRAAFVRLIGISVLQSGASAVLAPSLKHVGDALALAWRKRLTQASHAYYLRGNNYFSVSQLAAMQVWASTESICEAVQFVPHIYPLILSPDLERMPAANGPSPLRALAVGRLQDVDQRITRDVDRLCADLAALVPTMVKPVVDILWFSSQLWALTGRRGTAILYIYAALGFGCLRCVHPPCLHTQSIR